jgi:hypothetical protein
MVIGQYILVSTINDDTGAEAVLNILSSAWLKKVPEESVKEIIIFPGKKGVDAPLHQLTGADIDYGRAHLPYSPYYSVLPGKDLVCPA